MMRVFYAIEFDDDIKEYFRHQQSIIKPFIESANFSDIQNFHLTLRFIGEINPAMVQVLDNVLLKTSKENRAFDIYFTSNGYFKKKNKHIIWQGVNSNQSLFNLKESLENNLKDIGIEKDTINYKPHITLARQAIIKDKEGINIENNSKLFRVNNISLMESTRINNKLRYICIKKYSLI